MSTLLESAGIRPHVGWDPAHLDPAPDLVIVGNAVPRDNPEAREAERRGLPRLSMPEALARFFLAGRRPLVVAGTHGKTTTTAMAAWVWSRCGADPGYLVGGVPLGLPGSFRAGAGERFIVEGDEYNAAYFDRGPKFLHYRPETLILTSVEHDHADLYPDPASLHAAYRELLARMPPEGLAIVCAGDRDAVALAREAARCRVVTYGLEPAPGGEAPEVMPLGPVEEVDGGSRFRVGDPESGEIELGLAVPGRHNAENALAVWAAARADGLPAAAVAAALGSFEGVKRRQEELGTAAGVTVVDDFAHHPTAVRRTLEALAGRYRSRDGGRRRLVACFEPRSLTAGRAHLAAAYAGAFAAAGAVLLAPVFHARRLGPDQALDREGLVDDLAARGVDAHACASTEDLLARALEVARPGDVLVTMSSGSFDGLPHRLLAALRARPSSYGGLFQPPAPRE